MVFLQIQNHVDFQLNVTESSVPRTVALLDIMRHDHHIVDTLDEVIETDHAGVIERQGNAGHFVH